MMIAQSRPHITEEDFRYLDEIIRSGYVAPGPIVEKLQSSFSKMLGVRHSVAVSTGTAALHLALLALGVKPGDEIILPSYVCASVLNAIDYTGANAVLTEIEPVTLNPTAEIIEGRLTSKTKAVILTHTFGFPADLDGILSLGIPVIEDCAQALGATFRNKQVGSWGTISVFSFYATKMICSGHGGMVCTGDDQLAEALRDLSSPDARDNYRVRYNYRMSDLVAGLAVSQLSKLPGFVNRRREIAGIYRHALSDCDVVLQQAIPHSEPAFYRFVCQVERASEFIQRTREDGVFCDRPVSRPLHDYLGMKGSPSFENTDQVWNRTVSIPLYPSLSEAEISSIISVVTETAAALC
jgi:perosamine synthetase